MYIIFGVYWLYILCQVEWILDKLCLNYLRLWPTYNSCPKGFTDESGKPLVIFVGLQDVVRGKLDLKGLDSVEK